MKYFLPFLSLLLLSPFAAFGEEKFESDIIKTDGGDLKIIFVGHGSVVFYYMGVVIHIDPYGKLADYSMLPDADIVLITHQHRDHLDQEALEKITKADTEFVVTDAVYRELGKGKIMANGDSIKLKGINIEAVPAYNIIHKRENGEPYHPKGEGNGYILTTGNKRIYIAGDTENIPEMELLTGIDIAFIPMNLPYTMDPGMAADAVMKINPEIVYPYHYGDSDTSLLVKALEDKNRTEIRIRNMQ